MDRTLCYKKEVVNGITELDFMNNNLSKFTFNRDPLYYRVGQGDLQAPDNIAYKVYGDERLWWVICIANEIACPCADITVGLLLKVPDLLDVYDYYRTYRKR